MPPGIFLEKEIIQVRNMDRDFTISDPKQRSFPFCVSASPRAGTLLSGKRENADKSPLPLGGEGERAAPPEPVA